MNPKILSAFEPTEWDHMAGKLDMLSLDELRKLTTQVGIEFSDGNANIIDKQEFISVLDEADQNELKAVYEAIVENRN